MKLEGTVLSEIRSVQFSLSVMFDSLQPHELHYARPLCPSENRPRLLPLWPTLSSAALAAPTSPTSNPPVPTHHLATAWRRPAPHPPRRLSAHLAPARADQSAQPGPCHGVLSGHSLSLSQSASQALPSGGGAALKGVNMMA